MSVATHPGAGAISPLTPPREGEAGDYIAAGGGGGGGEGSASPSASATAKRRSNFSEELDERK